MVRTIEDQKAIPDPVEHQWWCLQVMPALLFTFLPSISPVPRGTPSRVAWG